MADILVTSPFQPFTLPTQFKAVFNGYIYCGTVDAVDPSVSQVQVYLVNEAGDKVPVAQPLRTNAGGFLVYNGQPAKFVTDSNHSLLVQDSLHVQVWYAPDVAVIDPESFLAGFLPEAGTETFLVPTRFSTLQDGVDWILMNRHPTNNYIAALVIEAGHQPSSGVVVRNANSGFIYIRSAGGEVTLSNSFPNTANFIDCENGTAPTLDALINANGRCSIGYLAQNNAYGRITAGNGIKNTFGTGLAARYGAVVHANGTIWTGAAQGLGLTSGILSWAAAISAESADVSDSLHYGAQSAHGGWLSFRAGKANNCFRYGIRATDSGFIDADGAQASDCGLNGVRAFNLGIINFRDGVATGCGSNSDDASAAVSAASGSIVNAQASNLSLAKYQAVISFNSTVTVSGANLTGAYRYGINARGASNVDAGGTDVSNAGANGINTVNSTVNCSNLIANNCAGYGIAALEASVVNAPGAQAKSCGTGGITSRDGSVVNAKGSDTTGTLAGNCLFAWAGKIVATNATAQAGASPAATDIRVFEGGEISANASTIGGLSQAANTVTADGIIFK